jgi:hypothetical protein
MAIGANDAAERSAGVDVGTDRLELAVDGEHGGPTRRFADTPVGVAAVVGDPRRTAPRPVAVEATGAYPHPLLQALGGAAVPVAVVDPARVTAFRRTRLGRNKTDRPDALLPARFAAVHAPELRAYAPPPAAQQELRRLLVDRDAVSKWRTVLRNQQEVSQWTGAEAVGDWLGEDLDRAEARLRAIDAAIGDVLKRRPEAEVLRAVKGPVRWWSPPCWPTRRSRSGGGRRRPPRAPGSTPRSPPPAGPSAAASAAAAPAACAGTATAAPRRPACGIRTCASSTSGWSAAAMPSRRPSWR